MELKSPTKKGFKLPSPSAPLPICYDSSDSIYSSEFDWPLFTGKYNGNSVIIDENSEIVLLSNKGFFGKGSLSRGSPNACRRKAHIKVINESQWKRRKIWVETLSTLLSGPHLEQSKNISTKEEDEKSLSKETALQAVPSAGEMKDNSEVSETGKAETENNENLDTKKLPSSEVSEIEVSELPKNEEELKDSNINSGLSVRTDEDLKNNDAECVNNAPTSKKNTSRDTMLNQILNDDELLVISDLGNDLDESLKNLNPHIEKENMKTVIEVLYLSLEEAFFLSYAIKCLQVVDLAEKYLSNKEMWNLFQQAQPNFIENYVAYHHFRSKGWVVKSGLKYGGDFLLYKKGPLYYHASYIVLVKLLNSDGTKANDNNAFSWEKMLVLNRMSETATKEILVCEVMKPDAPKEMFQDPSILKEFKLSEILLRRWQPTQEKDT